MLLINSSEFQCDSTFPVGRRILRQHICSGDLHDRSSRDVKTNLTNKIFFYKWGEEHSAKQFPSQTDPLSNSPEENIFSQCMPILVRSGFSWKFSRKIERKRWLSIRHFRFSSISKNSRFVGYPTDQLSYVFSHFFGIFLTATIIFVVYAIFK